MQKKKTFSINTMVLIGVLGALVFALSIPQIRVPLFGGTSSRIHLGNAMCLLSGVLFGPMIGGLASGFGSMIYDFTDPLYAPEFWITFIMKFAMGTTAGFLATRLFKKIPVTLRYVFSALGGAAVYLVLYLAKIAIISHFIQGMAWPAVWLVVGGNAVTSGINALLAVVACALLAPALSKALNITGFFKAQKVG